MLQGAYSLSFGGDFLTSICFNATEVGCTNAAKDLVYVFKDTLFNTLPKTAAMFSH